MMAATAGIWKITDDIVKNVDNVPKPKIKTPTIVDDVGAKGTGKKVIIGENMSRVERYSTQTGAETYKGLPNYSELKKTMSQGEVDKLAIEHNKQWIQKQIDNGAEVIDIGPDFDRRLERGYGQPAYEMERTVTKDYQNYKKVFERFNKYSGGVKGVDW
jgi:hypothetical protein